MFKYDWLVVLKEQPADIKTVIVNDKEKLSQFYEEHKDKIWVGFNSKNYDQWILRAILSGFNPYDMNAWIIEKGKDGYLFNSQLNKISLYNYDVWNGVTDYGLKTLEGFMGENIKESEIDFRIDRKLNPLEISKTIEYCTSDVENLERVFIERINEFDSQIDLIKTFKLPLSCISKTPAQLAAIILGAVKQSYDDEFEIKVPDTLQLNKYAKAEEWFLNSYDDAKRELDRDYKGAVDFLNTGVGSKKAIKDMTELVDDYTYNYDETLKKYFYRRSLTLEVCGVEHNFGWGGVHAAKSKYIYKCKPDELILMADVDQLYPTLMVVYNLLSRSVTKPELFKEILATSLRLKAEKKKKEREPYKKICNITYGAEGDKFNPMYDPLHRNLVCVYGQLLLLDLLEKLEPHIIDFIQSNTDGVALVIKRKDFNLIDDIVYEWEQRTGLHMSFDCYKAIYQGDVNNYVLVPFKLYDEKGKPQWKSKGAYVKSLSKLDNDLPIVNKALIDYMIQDIPVEKTINDCQELIMFQKIVKLSSKYQYVKHNGVIYKWKSYRVFASLDSNDGIIYKCKGDKCDKFANTPERCFIENSDIKDVKVPDNLDKQYYIDLAKQRLKDKFGFM